MTKKLLQLAAAVALLTTGHQAAMADDTGKMVLLPQGSAVKWGAGPANLPKGTQLAVLAGDPAQPGPFVLRVKIPAHAVIGPHTHSSAENLTMISGILYHEMGEKLDKNAGDKLQPGGFVYLPGGMPHSVWTAGEPVIVQVTGTGPFGVNYLNPADDPSKRQTQKDVKNRPEG